MAAAGTTTLTESGTISRDGSEARSVSEMAAAGPTTLTESGNISRGGPEAIQTQDREVLRPDPVDDPRWQAAIRARGSQTPISRGDPGTEVIISLTTDRTTSTEATHGRATGMNSGTELGRGAADGSDGTEAIVRLTTDRTTSTGPTQGRATGVNNGTGTVGSTGPVERLERTLARAGPG